MGACAWFWFMGSGNGNKQVYGAAILSGIGGSTMLVTSLAMCADLIKHNTVSRHYSRCIFMKFQGRYPSFSYVGGFGVLHKKCK